MIKKNLPFILLALGAALIVYMHYAHNNSSCCGHKGHTHEHHDSHTHSPSHAE